MKSGGKVDETRWIRSAQRHKLLPEAPEGWEFQRRGNQLVLYSKADMRSGIDIRINKGAKTLEIGGWYDSCVGIQGGVIPLSFIESLFK